MKQEWEKAFFENMEKRAIMGAIVGAMNVSSTLGDIKSNKAKTRLAAPTTASAVSGNDPYSHQFRRSMSHTPGKSMF